MDENSKRRRILIRKSILFNFAFMVHHHTTSFSRCNFDFKKSGHEKNARFHEFLLLGFIQKQAGANDQNSLKPHHLFISPFIITESTCWSGWSDSVWCKMILVTSGRPRIGPAAESVTSLDGLGLVFVTSVQRYVTLLLDSQQSQTVLKWRWMFDT